MRGVRVGRSEGWGVEGNRFQCLVDGATDTIS